jgi:aminoglycoside phosphotransferase family enzyme/predicted kinase
MQPQAYAHEVRGIQLIETHISWVLLTGEFAYKIKRPVVYPFLDLRSAERRGFYCTEELRLNRRFAPDLYLEVCDIREDQGAARIGGSGRVIERCVKMRQFPRDRELDRLLAAGHIEAVALERFGQGLADIHAGLPVAGPTEPWGSAAGVQRGVLENVDQYVTGAASAGYDDDPALRPAFDVKLAALVGDIDLRRTQGRVRECHGDLHARNIVQGDAGLVAFDCMEFEPAFRWIDVAEEIALLIADLQARDFPQHAHAFLSGYLGGSGDYHACRVLDLYKAHRALVRAKVATLEITSAADEAAALAARREHDEKLGVARLSLAAKSPVLVLMAGLSGSGKTWLARRLAPDVGAIHLRSDVERKRLAGLEESADSRSGTAAGLYGADSTRHVYEHLAKCAEHVLAGGYPAIVDATFMTRAQRALFRELAQRMSVRLQVIQCDAPMPVLRKRILERRRLANDASEADLAILDWQLAHQEPITPAELLEVVKVSTTGEDPLPSLRAQVTP